MKMKFFLVLVAFSFSIEHAFSESYFDDEEGRTLLPRKELVRRSTYISTNNEQLKITPFGRDSNNLSIGLGQVFLMGDSSQYSDSLGTRINYTYGVSQLFGFESSFNYSSHSEGKYSQYSLLGGVRGNLNAYDQLIPYLNGGIGFFRPSKQINENASFSATLFGMYVGAGIDLKISKDFYFGPNLQIQNVFGTTKTTSLGEMSLGGSSLNIMARAGCTF